MNKTIVSLAVALAFFSISSAQANPEYNSKKTSTQGNNNKQVVYSAKLKKGALINVTNGYREISGWERDVLKRDKNLRHWKWLPMVEAKRAYIRIAPGKDPLPRGSKPRKSIYKKPVRVIAGRGGTRKKPQPIIASAPRKSIYTKPVHVATQLTPRLRAQDTDIALRSRDGNAGLRLPNGEGDLHGKLGAKNTDIQLASRNTDIQLAAPQTAAQLRAKDGHAALLPQAPVAKTYESYDYTQTVNGNLAAQKVSGKLMTKRSAAVPAPKKSTSSRRKR